MDNKWVSVKERLPEDNCMVLVSDGDGIEMYDFIKTPQKPWKQWEPIADGQHYFVYHKAITHWQPLPEPPEVA